MAPHRAQPMLSSVALFRQAFAAPTDSTAGVVAGLAAIASSFWNLHVVLLLILVVAVGLTDLWTGTRRARIRKRMSLPGGFERAILDEGIGGKAAVLVAILLIGVSADSVGALIGGFGGLGIETLFQSLTPVTAVLLAYRLGREIVSVKENVEDTPGGKGAIWPGIARIVDVLRFTTAHPGSGPTPEDRWGDHVTPVERAWLDAQLEELRKGDANA